MNGSPQTQPRGAPNSPQMPPRVNRDRLSAQSPVMQPISEQAVVETLGKLVSALRSLTASPATSAEGDYYDPDEADALWKLKKMTVERTQAEPGARQGNKETGL